MTHFNTATKASRKQGLRLVAAMLLATGLGLHGLGYGLTLRMSWELAEVPAVPRAVDAVGEAPANGGAPLNPAESAASLQESIVAAVARSPKVREAEAAWRAARQAAGQADSALYPSVDLVTGARSSRVGLSGHASSPQASGVTLSYSLYDGGKIRGDLEERSHQARGARERLAVARQDVAFKAAQAHLQVAKYRAMVGVGEDNIASHEKIVGQMLEIAAIDQGRRVDVTLAQARLAQARANLNLTLGKLREARQAYLRLIGWEPPRLLGESLAATSFEASDDALTQAVQAHPAFRALEAEAEAARTAARTAKSSNYPQVNLEMAVSNEKDIFNQRISPTVGVVMRWNVFRGFGDMAAQRAAVERSVAATERLYEAGMEVREQILQAQEEIDNLQDRIRYLEARSTETDRVRGAYLEQFRIGRRTLLDLLNAESEYSEARSNGFAARYDLFIAQARLRHAQARLADPLLADAPEEAQRDPVE